MLHADAAVVTGPGDAATPRPAGSPWYTVQEPAPGDGRGLAGELGLGEELGLVAVAVAAPAVPPAVIHSAAIRPASHPAVRTVRPLRIVKD